MELLNKDGFINVDLKLLKPYSNCPDSLKMDLTEVYVAESRKNELASVNRLRAPELLNALGRGHGFAAEAFVKASHYTNLVGNAVRKREALVILDEAQKILIDKGLTSTRSPGGSADFRAAVVAADIEYGELLDLYERLKAIRGLLQAKSEGLERHFFAVQSILRSESKGMGMEDGHRDVSSGYSAVTSEDTGFFGKARL